MPSLFVKKSLALAVGVVLSGLSQAATVQTRSVEAAQPSVAAIAASVGDASRLVMRAGIFDPLAETIAVDGVVHGLAEAPADSRYAIVQFGSVTAEARRALEAQGVTFLGYVPNNAYYVRLEGIGLDAVRASGQVRWAGSVAPGLKVDPRLYTKSRAGLAANPETQRYDLEVETFKGESPDVVAAALRRAVADLVVTHVDSAATTSHRVIVSVKAADVDAAVAAASAIDGVQFVAPWARPKLSNSGSIGAVQGNATGACTGSGVICGPSPLFDHQLFGSGQIVAVADSGLDADEAWFTTLDKGTGPVTAITPGSSPALPAAGTTFPNNKVFAYWVQPGATAGDNNRTCPGGFATGYHGTHVNGTVAGDAAGTFGANTYVASTPLAANHELADGMAPNAQLLFQDIGNDTSGCLSIQDFAGTLRQAVAGGARIHSNSWGAPTFGEYGGNDANVDGVTREKEDLLVVIAAGNEGDLSVADGCPSGNFSNGVCASSVGSPGNSKNALTVGALNHAGSTAIIGFSSRGPTSDGRLKPDIMAPGTAIVSASGDATIGTTPQAPLTKSLSGTSMATPTVAGNTALVRQFFADGFYPRGDRNAADTLNPSGPVLKAVLLNGTRVLDSWPTMNTGWGRAWLDGNLWFAGTQAGGDDSRRLRVFERTNASGLRTGESNSYTIANVAAGAELRATLTWYDVAASSAAGLALVNNLDLEVTGPGGTVYRGNVFAGGVSATGGSADALNTVEQVRLTAPAAGSYTFRVTGTAVPGNGDEGSDRQGYGLAVSGAFGLPDQAAFAAPAAPAVAGNGAGGVSIGFTSAAAPQGFQLYRANGSCAAAAPGDFRLVATGNASPLVDDTTQGGFQYAYKVRGVSNDVEGAASACVDVTSADTCHLMPSAFAIGGANGANATCGVNLTWASSQSSCPASSAITYKVLRSTSPAFTAPTTVIDNLAATTWLDSGVTNGQAYFYKVVSVDAFGNERATTLANATTSGSAGPDPTTYLDDADSRAYARLEGSWIIADTAANDGTHSYHTGPEGSSSPNCAALYSTKLAVTSDSALSYFARYNLESQWDGVVVEVSADDGATWTDLPPVGGYPSTFAQTGSPPGNLCGYAASHGAFNGASTASSNAGPNETPAAQVVFKPFSHSLKSYAGKNVVVRWRVSSDANTDFGGFWLDTVRVGRTDVLFDDPFEEHDYVCH